MASEAATTQKLLDKEREKHRASKRAAKLAADQAKGLKQALETEKQKTAAAEERARQFEVALFEERARSAKALAEQRAGWLGLTVLSRPMLTLLSQVTLCVANSAR